MSRYPEPRELRLSWGDVQRSLTILDLARAAAAAGVPVERANELVGLALTRDGDPDAVLAGALLIYAIAWQLERKIDPSVTWDEAQSWRVIFEADPVAQAQAADEAALIVGAAILSGVPPAATAGELTLAQLDAYADARQRATRARRRRAS
jgi:hypothetical protein